MSNMWLEPLALQGENPEPVLFPFSSVLRYGCGVWGLGPDYITSLANKLSVWIFLYTLGCPASPQVELSERHSMCSFF